MLLKRYGRSVLYLVAICLCATTASVKADVLVERDSTVFGKIKEITNSTVSIAPGCDDKNVRSVPKERVRYYQFDSTCQPHRFTLPTSPLQFCAKPKQKMNKIVFRGQGAEVYATEVLLSNRNLVRLILANNAGSLQGPLSRIRAIVPASVCPDSIPDKFTWPRDYCHEPFKLAVNFSLKPVFNNKIFTRGFTFYLDVIGAGPKESSEDFARAFGAALTLWASKLLDLRPKLPPNLASFVDSALARSKSFTLFTPPQVVQVDCPENAVMIVKLYKQRVANLFPARRGYVAKSQLEGRTILLNGLDFKFRADLDTSLFMKNDHLNLTTVFAHELGHCFGLDDVDLGSGMHSVMSPDDVEHNRAGGPTDYDGLEFVRILQRVISGARPGEFNPTECRGLRLISAKGHSDEHQL